MACADCGSKLHFATCKNIDGKQDHYVCAKYKSGRGTCSVHYIREDVLRDVELERIRAVTEYIRADVEHFQEDWLMCRREEQEKSIQEDKRRLEKAKMHLADINKLITHIYEDMTWYLEILAKSDARRCWKATKRRKRTQKVKIVFNFLEEVNVPEISEPVITQTTYGRRGRRDTRSRRPLRQIVTCHY